MSKIKPALILGALGLFSFTAQAENTLNATHQQQLSLTLYQNGLGFVRDTRRTDLSKGQNDLAFEDVSTQLIPDSLLINTKGIEVLERRFAFDLLTPQALLDKAVGKTVSFRKFNSVTGKDDIISAKILSTKNGVIVERDGQIQVGQPGQLMLEKLPQGLRAKPALLASLNAPKKASFELGLAYLSNGLKWHSSYSAELSPDGKSVNLRSWANLTNTSGTDYKNATLSLAAGQINKKTVRKNVQMMARSAPQTMMAMDSAPERTASPPQALGGLHLYSLPHKVDLAHKETKQVQLMAPMSFKSKRVLVRQFGPSYNAISHQVLAVHPNIEVSFTNASNAPLPTGIVRLYRKDQAGELQFVGEDRLKATPKGNEAKLHPGQSFDVTLKRSQTEFEFNGKHSFEAAYKVVIKNAKDTAETMRVSEAFPGQWKIEKSSHKTTRRENNRAIWEINVPANGQKTLSYEVNVRTR
ncbi:conserved exported hypothetical protein [Candidatus Terasakiella magnetica]|uniref:DUF4139 domain-containing protein n=1 Tax=Candidatus Terasakiella magnetica TaxID=1867952 RepID=A0A1C3RIC3_9PROT|nr:DUF4139 domain-containing protein [Candidatus Terasakiella magnetica]SCA57021.1 conserved exported hypothetical protein [Candidatus Terasakiella magnetica]